MKKRFIPVFLLLVVQLSQAQSSQLIYGRVNRYNGPTNARYTIPASNIKILLMESSYTGIRVDKTICNKAEYSSQVKVFMTDSKGEYNFKGLRRGTKYRLIICDTKNGKVYSTEIQTPASGSTVRVPDRNI